MRKILISLLLIAFAAALSGGGVFALFSDTETATGNQINTGDAPDLRLEDSTPGNDPAGDSVAKTWVMSDMEPGVSEHEETILLWNDGGVATVMSISISYIETEVGSEESETSPTSVSGMAKYLEITKLKYDAKNLLDLDGDYDAADKALDVSNIDQDYAGTPWNEIDDVNGNGWVDLDDFENQPLTYLLPVPQPSAANCIPFTMKIKFRSEAPNDYQGDKVTMTVTFTLKD